MRVDYLLRPNLKLGFVHQDLIIGIHREIVSSDKAQQEVLLRFCAFLKTPQSQESMMLFLQKEGLSTAEAESLFDAFLKFGFIINHGHINKEERYSRNHLFFHNVYKQIGPLQEKLNQLHVCIRGCGSTGNMVSLELINLGVKKLTLIDDDVIEASNITRQFMFTNQDIGQKKVAVLAKALHQRADSLCINICENDNQITKDVNLVIMATDPKPTHDFDMFAFCHDHQIPHLSMGYLDEYAIFGPFVIPGKTACKECYNNRSLLSPDSEDDQFNFLIEQIKADPMDAASGPMAAIVGSFVVLEILSYLSDVSLMNCINTVCHVDTLNLSISRTPIQPFFDCQHCRVLFQD